MNESVKRPYNATRRQAQARETRATVVRAAQALFLEQGYGATTVAPFRSGSSMSTIIP